MSITMQVGMFGMLRCSQDADGCITSLTLLRGCYLNFSWFLQPLQQDTPNKECLLFSPWDTLLNSWGLHVIIAQNDRRVCNLRSACWTQKIILHQLLSAKPHILWTEFSGPQSAKNLDQWLTTSFELARGKPLGCGLGCKEGTCFWLESDADIFDVSPLQHLFL